MGTVGELLLPAASKADAAETEARARAAFRETAEAVEAEFSIFREGSVPSRLAAGETVVLPEASRRLFELVDTVWEASDGAYDPTVGPLMHLWGFRGRGVPDREPGEDALAATLAECGWRRVVGRDGDAVRLAPGAKLDFGGAAKGLAVDLVWERMRKEETAKTGFLVNFGGNIRVSGIPRPGADGWMVAVRDPFRPYGEASVGAVTLSDGMAVATSGNYERFVEIGGVRYAHILDPRTGWPVRGLAQVTVVAPTAAQADALSTACFVLGPEASKPLLAAFPGTSAYFIPDVDSGGLSAAVTVDHFPWLAAPAKHENEIPH